MMRLICNGVALDIKSDASITFTRQNPLFAFDNMSCERTNEFALPATPTNDRVLSCARIPAYTGDGMRRKFTAQLQDGVVVKNGYLYISEYSGGEYKGIFVCGDLVALQAIKDAGNLSEYMYFSEYATVNDYQHSGEIFSKYTYLHDTGYDNPSIKLQLLTQRVAQHFGVSVEYPSELSTVRIIPTLAKSLTETGAALTRNFVANPTTGSYPVVNTMSQNESKLSLYFTTDTTGRASYTTSDATYYAGKVAQLKTNTGLRVSFAADTSDDIFCGYFNNSGYFTFYGDYSFTRNSDGEVITSGKPLAGRSVDVEKDGLFVIVHKYDYIVSGGTGWKITQNISANCTFSGINDRCANGERCRLQDCLPECSFVDILKTVAAISGKQLNYENGVLSFETLNFANWGVFDISGRVTKYGKMQRTFGKYAQKNTVSFDTSENVPDAARLSVEYTIDNDTLESENELRKIPFSEGNEARAGAAGDLIIYDANRVEDADSDTLCREYGLMLYKISLPKNQYLQQLCDSSTTISVSVSASMYEAETITPKTRILLNGTLYVWDELKYNGGKIEMSLSKI